MQMQSNSKQDLMMQNASGKATKNGKKKILIISGTIIVIIILLVLFLPPSSRITNTHEEAMRIRCVSLTSWYKLVKSYISDNNQVPLSLFEVCQAAYRKGQEPFPMGGYSVSDGFPKEYTTNELNDPNGFRTLYTVDLLNDPNLFKKKVPYGLFQSSEGWFIRELRPGKIYKKMLMIDQDEQIYEIREIPKEEYKYP